MHNYNSQIYALLNSTGLQSQKASLVQAFTGGRSESTKELTDSEARELIKYLQRQQDPNANNGNKMRRKLIAIAHEMHWHIPGTQKVDMQRIDNWCMRFSYLHKKLNSYTTAELPALLSQFEQVYKHFLKSI